MQRYFDVVQSRTGDAIVGGLVYVYISGTTTLATLYADNGVTLQANPVTTNSDGEYAFYAANGTYTLQITATNYATEVKPGVVMFDPSDNVSFGNNVTLVAGTANGVLYLNGSKVVTSGSALVFDGTNLGIGTTPSAWNAAFKGVELNNGAFLATTNGPYVTYNAYFSSNWLYKTNAAASHYLQTGGEHHWYNAPSGTAGNLITFTQAMTLDASGRLGIGTNAPVARLQVVGAIHVGSGSAETGGACLIYNNGNDVTIEAFAGNDPVGTKRNLLLSTYGGKVGIGTSSPGYTLSVNGDTAVLGQNTLRLQNSDNTNAYALQNGGATGSGNAYLAFVQTGVAERLRIKSQGQTRFVPLAADPAGAENGDVYYNSTTNKLRVYAGGAWVDLH